MIEAWRDLSGTDIVCGQPIEFWVNHLPLNYDEYSYTDNAFMGHEVPGQWCMERLGPSCGTKFMEMEVANWLEEMMSLFTGLVELWERGIANNISRAVMSRINGVYREWINNMGKLATDEMPESLEEPH